MNQQDGKKRKLLVFNDDYSQPCPQLVISENNHHNPTLESTQQQTSATPEDHYPWKFARDYLIPQLLPNDKELVHEISASLTQEHATLADLVIIIPHDQKVPLQYQQQLEDCREKLGIQQFRYPQDAVCDEILKAQCSVAHQKNSIIFLAPCGYGKSMCFVVPTIIDGGLTLVIEPLRDLIQSQLQNLQKYEQFVATEKLYSVEEAARKKVLATSDRLQQIMNEGNNSNRPMILFATPELLTMNSRSAEIIAKLVQKRLLRRIVFDEFDSVEATNSKFRPNMGLIHRSLMTSAPRAVFVFLSATAKEPTIKSIASLNGEKNKPKLFMAPDHLPQKHIYSVEQKVSDEQCIERMIAIMNDITTWNDVDNDHQPPRCICYCLTRKKCKDFATLFQTRSYSAAVWTSDESNDEKCEILEKFNKGNVSIICATSSLGRGVHLPEIGVRFVFHVVMPPSLGDYVQQTGRVGRDGKGACCVLFFGYQDRKITEYQVVQPGKLFAKEKEHAVKNLKEVFSYATSKKLCRSTMLARTSQVNDPLLLNPRRCKPGFMCDNCKYQTEGNINCKNSFYSVDMTPLLVKYFTGSSCQDVFCIDKFRDKTSWDEFLQHMDQFFCNLSQTESIPALEYLKQLNLPHRRSFWCSLLGMGFSFGEYHWSNPQHRLLAVRRLIMILASGKTVHIRHLKFFDSARKKKWTPALLEVDTLERDRLLGFPFLIQFEIERLQLTDVVNRKEHYSRLRQKLEAGLIDACQFLHELAQREFKYRAVLERCQGGALFFRGHLQNCGKVSLDEPALPQPKRIYWKTFGCNKRTFGCDRFFELNIDAGKDEKMVLDFLCRPMILCNRTWNFLWGKKGKSPQTFILFAEEGTGIDSSDAMTVDQLKDECLPSSLNQDFTLAKFSKRMKLWFSSTTPGCFLSGHIQLLPNFLLADFEEIDGAGLISQRALDDVWIGWQLASGMNEDEISHNCPYTGFQFRCEGLKGTLVLDPALKNEWIIQVRESQIKFNTKLLTFDGIKRVLVSDQWQAILMEVCSWDTIKKTSLNIRMIQLLSYWGVPFDYFRKCQEQVLKASPLGMDFVNGNRQGKDFHDDSTKSWLKFCASRRSTDTVIKGHFPNTDSQTVYEMCLAQVDLNDPEFRRRRLRLLEKDFSAIRDKAHYPMNKSATVRMYPDHTFLLQENEAFLAVNGVISVRRILACRSPSYLPGDLRSLKLVTLEMLSERATKLDHERPNSSKICETLRRTPVEKIDFFRNIRNALVLSNVGGRSEADRMSGGDYDGDNATVIWNEEVLSFIHREIIPSVETRILRVESGIGEDQSEEDRNVWNCPRDKHISYLRHHRNHQRRLGIWDFQLNVHIDKFSFDDVRTCELGKALFLQVDVPYHCYKFKKGVSISNTLQTPHWMGCKTNFYKSDSVLGRLYDSMNDAISKLALAREQTALVDLKMSMRIQRLIKDAEKSNKKAIDEIRNIARNIAVEFIADKRIYLDRNVNSTNDEYSEWMSKYCSNKRHSLILSRKSPLGDISLVTAAILYEQCFELEWNNSKALDFAYKVAKDEVLKIFCGENCLLVNRSITNDIFSLSKKRLG